MAEEAATDRETVAEERQAVRDEARRRGFELLERGLSSLRRATGYRRQSTRSALVEFFAESLLPEDIKPEPEIDLETIAEQLANKYVKAERLGERDWRIEGDIRRLREKLRADREAVEVLRRLVDKLEPKVEEKISLEQRFAKERKLLREDIDRLSEEGDEE